MPPLLIEAHAPHSQSEIEGGEGGGGHDGRTMRAGCEVLVVGCGSGCEGCVG
jgi:hypothetical protein